MFGFVCSGQGGLGCCLTHSLLNSRVRLAQSIIHSSVHAFVHSSRSFLHSIIHPSIRPSTHLSILSLVVGLSLIFLLSATSSPRQAIKTGRDRPLGPGLPTQAFRASSPAAVASFAASARDLRRPRPRWVPLDHCSFLKLHRTFLIYHLSFIDYRISIIIFVMSCIYFCNYHSHSRSYFPISRFSSLISRF